MTCRPQTRGGRARLGRYNHNRGGGLSSFSSLLVGQMKRLKKGPGKQKKNKLDGINEIDATSKTALPPTASERHDALERYEKKDGGVMSVAERVGWMVGTHLQGPHQSVCWLRPKRARHFLGEPGSEHNAWHAQEKGRRKSRGRGEETG